MVHSPVQEQNIDCLWITHDFITLVIIPQDALTLVCPILVSDIISQLLRPKTLVSSLILFSFLSHPQEVVDSDLRDHFLSHYYHCKPRHCHLSLGCLQ